MSLTKSIKDAFLVIFISAFILIFINLLLTATHSIIYTLRDSTRYSHLPDPVKNNYQHMSKDDVDTLLSNNFDHGWVYDETLGFKEAPRTTQFVNVNKFGIRSTKSEDDFIASLNNSIWFFGGSTTFGYGVADNETIPANLASLLNSAVINFGRGYYFSEQENLLMLKLLKNGYRPKKAIFLDGLNEQCSVTTYQEQMKRLFASAQKSHTTPFEYALNIMRPTLELFEKISKVLRLDQRIAIAQNNDLHKLRCSGYGSEGKLSAALNHNLEHRNAICNHFNISCTTFVQPLAGVHGKHNTPELLRVSKEKLLRRFSELKPVFDQHGAISVTSSLDQHPEHAFVDNVHYSAAANFLIAERISHHLAISPFIERAISGGGFPNSSAP